MLGTRAFEYLTINLQFHSATISVCLLRITVKITRCVQVMVRQRPWIKYGLSRKSATLPPMQVAFLFAASCSNLWSFRNPPIYSAFML